MRHGLRPLFAVLVGSILWAGAPMLATTLRIAVISDLNGSYGSVGYSERVASAISRILELKPDLVISTGDMVAGQRTTPPLEVRELEAMWQAFHLEVTLPLERAGIPLAVTPGNHDASGFAAFSHERAEYARQWAHRRPDVHFVDDSRFPFAYAFEMKGVLFVGLDATRRGAIGSSDVAWLRGLLGEDPEAAGGIEVVFGHLPVWPFAQGRESEFLGDEDLDAVLQSSVELYLSGHHHAYFPGVKDGVLHVSQPCLGSGPRRLIGSRERSRHGFTWIEVEDDGRIRIDAYLAPDFQTRIRLEDLPVEIETPAAVLQRMDRAATRASLANRR